MCVIFIFQNEAGMLRPPGLSDKAHDTFDFRMNSNPKTQIESRLCIQQGVNHPTDGGGAFREAQREQKRPLRWPYGAKLFSTQNRLSIRGLCGFCSF